MRALKAFKILVEILEFSIQSRNSRIPKACVILSCVFSFFIEIVRRGRTMTQGLSSPERNSKILWINLEFLKAFCVYRNSRIPYRDPHRYPPRGLRDDIVRNSRISRLNLEFLNLEFLEAFCVYRNSRIPYRDPRVKLGDDIVGR